MRKRSEAQRERDFKATEQRLQDWQIDVPSDVVNEQAAIAAMIADGEVRKRFLKRFSADAFSGKDNKAIVSGLALLEERKLEYDPIVVARLNPDVDVRTLETLAVARPGLPPNVDHIAETLAWDWLRATVMRGPAAAFLEAIQDQTAPPDRVRATARAIAEAFDGSDRPARYLRDSKQVVHEMMTRLQSRVAGQTTYPFGIEGLDFWEDGAENSKGEDISGTPRIVPGADPGGTTVLTGMSGSGKTTMAAHLINGLARQRRRVLVGAWEVRAPMTLELLTTLSLGWSRTAILTGKNQSKDDAMTREELVLFEEQAHRISRWVRFVDNPFRRGSVRTAGKVTNDDYLDILEEHVEASGCAVAVFDLFDRCLRHRRPDDEQEALWRMLEMVDRLQIHQIIVHQQLLKGDDVRKDMKPSLQGLKGSSAYVDSGALILAPHLPARWKDVPDDTLELYGLKQRFGAPFAIEFDWDPDAGQIRGGRAIPPEATSESSSDEAWSMAKTKKRRGRK